MMGTHSSRRALVTALAATFVLQACSDGATDSGETAQVSEQTLASMVSDDAELSTVAGVLGDAGLAQVFDGAASCTLLTPKDSAFDALGDPGKEQRTPEQRAAMVAILREHVVPGYLTPDDIANAIDAAGDGRVEMRTMGEQVVTFTEEGDAIIVTAEDGASAHFAGDALRASNGVAIPLDGVLKRVAAPAT